MNKQQLQEVMGRLGCKVRGGDEWLQCSCPWAPFAHHNGVDSNPSCTVKVEPEGESIVKCWTCRDHPYSLLDMVMDIRRLNKQTPMMEIDFGKIMALVSGEATTVPDVEDLPDFEDDEKAQTFFPFDESWLESFPPAFNHPYMKARGISESEAHALGVVLDPHNFRVAFPIRNAQGVLAGLHGRDITNIAKMRHYAYQCSGHRNPDVWLGEDGMDLDKPLVVTEGIFDYAKVHAVYENVIAGCTASVSKKKMAKLRDAYHLISFYDFGVGGSKAREKMQRFCLEHGILHNHITPTEKEGDAGAMSTIAIRSKLKAVL